MENLSYIGLSQQVALQQQMDLIAQNLANMNTPGYKSENPLFTDYLGGDKAKDKINQVINARSYRDLSPASVTQTYNPLDVAISGDGYFAIASGGGTKYTRDGSFALNAAREIVTANGETVQSDGGGAIVVPQDANKITITATGDVSTEDGILAKLKIVNFADQQRMTHVGNNLLDSGGQAETPIEAPRVIQGAVEGSNVNPVLEMTRMTEVTRMFQMAQSMQQTDHDRQRRMIESLSKTV